MKISAEIPRTKQRRAGIRSQPFRLTELRRAAFSLLPNSERAVQRITAALKRTKTIIKMRLRQLVVFVLEEGFSINLIIARFLDGFLLTFLTKCGIMVYEGCTLRKRGVFVEKKVKILSFMAILSAGVLLISNLSATKIFSLAGIPFDGGTILFPLSYVLGDLVVELYGKKVAKTVIWSGFMLNVLAVATFFIVQKLPAYPGWENQAAFEAILGFAPRIVAGSLLAYVSSSLVNNVIFEKIRESQKTEEKEKKFYARALGSSLVAHLIDALIFETVAFLGVLPFKDFLIQAVFAYASGLLLETLLYPVTAIIARILRKRLEIRI